MGLNINGGMPPGQAAQVNLLDVFFDNEFVFIAHKVALVASIILAFVVGPTLPIIFSVAVCLIHAGIEIERTFGCIDICLQDIGLKNNDEETSRTLFREIASGDFNAVEAICRQGLDLNKVDPYTGESPLYVACKRHHFLIVDLLLANGAIVPKIEEVPFHPIQAIMTDIEADTKVGFLDVGKLKISLRLFTAVTADGSANHENYLIAEGVFNAFVKIPNFENCLTDELIAPFSQLREMFFETLFMGRTLSSIHGLKNEKVTSKEVQEMEHESLKRFIIQACRARAQAADSHDFDLVATVLSKDDPSVCLVETGFVGHFIHIVFDKSGYMVVSNRSGNLPEHTEALQAYPIDFNKVGPEILQKLQQMKQQPQAEALKYIYTDLPASLAVAPGANQQDNTCADIRALAPKKAKPENEYWCSLKTAIKAVVALKKVEAGGSAKDAVPFAKEFSTAMREDVIAACEHRPFCESGDLDLQVKEARVRLLSRKWHLKIEPNLFDPATGVEALFDACKSFDWPFVEFLIAREVKIPKMKNGEAHPFKIPLELLNADLNKEKFDFSRLIFVLRLFDLVIPDETSNLEGYTIALGTYRLYSKYQHALEQGTIAELQAADIQAILKKIECMYFDELFQRNVVGLINGIRDFNGVRYEGSYPTHANHLNQLLQQTCYECANEEPDFAEDYRAVAAALANRYMKDTFIFKAGFERHAVHLVFDSRGYLIVSDSGAGIAEGRTTLEAYWIDFSKVTKNLLDSVSKIHEDQRTDAEFSTYVYHDLPGILSFSGEPLQDDFCIALKRITRRLQDVGNCHWASLKGAARGVFALNRMIPCLHDKGQLGKEAEVAKRLSKHLSTRTRQHSIRLYDERFPDKKAFLRDAHLIEQGTLKLEKRLLPLLNAPQEDVADSG